MPYPSNHNPKDPEKEAYKAGVQDSMAMTRLKISAEALNTENGERNIRTFVADELYRITRDIEKELIEINEE